MPKIGGLSFKKKSRFISKYNLYFQSFDKPWKIKLSKNFQLDKFYNYSSEHAYHFRPKKVFREYRDVEIFILSRNKHGTWG